MKSKWRNPCGSFVEPFAFNKDEKIKLTKMAGISIDSFLIESFSRIIELARVQYEYHPNEETKQELLAKIKKIENGLSKSLGAMDELGEDAKDLLPQYIFLAERDLTGIRDNGKLNPNYDPRLELNIILKAIETMKSEMLGSKNARTINHTYFVERCIEVWIKNNGYIGSEIEQKKAWQMELNNPAVPLFLTIQYLLTFLGVYLTDPSNWIEKALGEKV
jgi:hypothetical protein